MLRLKIPHLVDLTLGRGGACKVSPCFYRNEKVLIVKREQASAPPKT